MKKRKPKSGVVYLLKSECGKYLKYGATKNITNRLRQINYKNDFNCKFKLIAGFASNDIFRDECALKWELSSTCFVFEYMILDECKISITDIIIKMRSICK